jgi:hypothetical protein
MLDSFDREFLAQRQSGASSAVIFIIAACANAIAAGVGERRRHRQVLHTNVLFSRLDFLLAWRMMLATRDSASSPSSGWRWASALPPAALRSFQP